MKRKFALLLLILLINYYSFGADIIVDDSVHSQIAKKYNVEDLPNLPSNLEDSDSIFTPNEFDAVPESKYTPAQSQTTTQTTSAKPTETTIPKQETPVQKTPTSAQNTAATLQQNVKSTNVASNFEAIKLRKGMRFRVINTKPLYDTMKKGTRITFVSTIAETSRYITIPSNTVFKGVIEDSHAPNLTGNGGLLVIRVTKMSRNGADYPINAKITMANEKKVFINNIKGKRSYWKNVAKKTSWGKKTYDRMWAKTKKYFKPGIEIILTPITFVTGTVAYGANIVASPVIAIFTKGGRLIIPKGSNFEIKLLEDAIIYK